jgi:hypothetical protein
MWWNSVVKLWENQCRSVFRCISKLEAGREATETKLKAKLWSVQLDGCD